MNAQAYYGMKDYIMAGSYLNHLLICFRLANMPKRLIIWQHLCDYNISPRPELDQENTKNAIEGFNIFINKFPNSPKIEDCKKRIIELEDKLVEKSYLNAKLYYDMKQYKAAVVALTNSLKGIRKHKYREQMMYLKLNSLYLYAENSLPDKQKERYQATLDDYYSFMEEFPKSTYSKDVEISFRKQINI